MKQATRMKLTIRSMRFTWAALISALMLIAFTPPASADPQGPWMLPARDLSAADEAAFGAQIAVAPDGTATAVWRNSNGSVIQSATRPPGGIFGAAIDLSAASLFGYNPQIAVTPDGTATVVWSSYNGIVGAVKAVTRPPGGSFGAAVDLSSADRSANNPQIGVAPDGTATVVWETYVGGFNDVIQAATRPPGGAFGAAVDLSVSAPSASSSSPQIAFAPDGTATAVWYRYGGNVSKIQAATRLPGGSFGAPVNLSPAGEDDPLPQIAVAPDGTATVVWSLYTNSNFRVQSVTRPPGGSFGTAIDLSAPGRNSFEPQIAIGPNGAATAVWRRFNGTNRIVQAATRPPGGPFGAAINLSAAGENAYGPQIAIGPDSNSTVVWHRSDGRNELIQATTRLPAGSFGAAVDLSAAGRNAYEPQVAIAPDGTATAVWRRNTGTSTIIQTASTVQPSRISRVRVSGPARLKRGRVAIYKVRILNSGKAVATGVRLRVSGRGTSFNAPVGRIAVGATRTVNVRVRPNRPGSVVATFRVTSFNAGGKTVKKRVFVRR